jgi:hypothetical protein
VAAPIYGILNMIGLSGPLDGVYLVLESDQPDISITDVLLGMALQPTAHQKPRELPEVMASPKLVKPLRKYHAELY